MVYGWLQKTSQGDMWTVPSRCELEHVTTCTAYCVCGTETLARLTGVLIELSAMRQMWRLLQHCKRILHILVA